MGEEGYVEEEQCEIVGGKEYRAPAGKSVTVSKGSIMRGYLENLPNEKKPLVVVFADDIELHVDDMKEAFYPESPNGGKAAFHSVFAYAVNGDPPGSDWKVEEQMGATREQTEAKGQQAGATEVEEQMGATREQTEAK